MTFGPDGALYVSVWDLVRHHRFRTDPAKCFKIRLSD